MSRESECNCKMPDTVATAAANADGTQHRFTSHASADAISFSIGGAYKEVARMARDVADGVRQVAALTERRKSVWLRNLQSICEAAPPKMRIGFCGATGTGKSSVINSLLGANIVATNAMRACTAVVIEVSYHHETNVTADITFVSKTKWQEQISLFLQDMKDIDIEDFKMRARFGGDSGEAPVVAWSKFALVYPDISLERFVQMSAEDIIGSNTEIQDMLGSTKTIVAEDAEHFEAEIAKYIDSNSVRASDSPPPSSSTPGPSGEEDSDPFAELDALVSKMSEQDDVMSTLNEHDPADMQMDVDPPVERESAEPTAGPATTESHKAVLWPLIEHVAISCNAPVLSTGAIFVDLPGMSDANAARNRVAKDNIAMCDHLFIFAPITRALDDSAANRLIGDSLKRQLINGIYDSRKMSFIMTKTDDIVPSEVIKNLDLDSDPRIMELKNQISECSSCIDRESHKLKRAETSMKEKKTKLAKAQDALIELEAKLKPPTVKEESFMSPSDPIPRDKSSVEQGSKRSTDADQLPAKRLCLDKSDNNVKLNITSDVQEKQMKKLKAMIEAGNKQLQDCLNIIHDITQNISLEKRDKFQAQQELKAYCSLQRSQISRQILQYDFRQNLKESQDEDQLEENILSSASSELPVFCCSSREYNKLKGLMKTNVDGDAIVFRDLTDTGIPALQSWCKTLSLIPQHNAAISILKQMKELVDGVQEYSQNAKQDIDIGLVKLKQQWETTVNQYYIKEKGLSNDVAQRDVHFCLSKIFNQIFHKETKKLRTHLRQSLEEICQQGVRLAHSEAHNNAVEWLDDVHHMTFRAYLRRNGSYQVDLNEIFMRPFYKAITPKWTQVFDFKANILKSFIESIRTLTSSILTEVKLLCPAHLQIKVNQQIEQCKDKTLEQLSLLVSQAHRKLDQEQKRLSRNVVPHVQNQLQEGYNQVLHLEVTQKPITVFRKKAFYDFLDEHEDIFLGLVNMLMDGVEKTIDSIQPNLQDAEELAEEVELSMSTLWDTVPKDADIAELTAQKHLRGTITNVQKQLALWLESAEAVGEISRLKEDISSSSAE